MNMRTRRRGSFAADVAPWGNGDHSVSRSAVPWPPPVPLVGEPPGAAVVGTDRVSTSDSVAQRHWLEVIFLLGLAGVFLANSVVAWLEPGGFTTLVHDSSIGGWFHLRDADWLVPLIGVNDLVVGLGVLATIWWRGKPQRLVLAWAGLWLLAVTLLKMTSLGASG